MHEQPRREIGVAPLLTDERHDLVESMVVERLEDVQEHVVGVLSKTRLARVSSRTVWGLLVQGWGPVWHTVCCLGEACLAYCTLYGVPRPAAASLSAPWPLHT